MKRIIRYFRDFYAHCGGAVIGYLLLTIVHKILAFISPPAAQRLIDAVIGGSGFVRAMIENAVITLLFVAALYFRNLHGALTENRVTAYAEGRVFSDMLHMPFGRLRGKALGHYLHLIDRDVDQITGLAFYDGTVFTLNVLMTVAMAVYLFRCDWVLTLVVLSVLPLFVIFSKLQLPRLEQAQEAVIEEQENLNDRLDECYAGGESIRATNAETHFMQRFESAVAKWLRAKKRFALCDTTYDILSVTGLMNIADTAIYCIGGWRALTGHMSVGMIMTFSLYFSTLWNSVEGFMEFFKEYRVKQVSLNRLAELHEQSAPIERSVKALTPLKTLSCENLSFAYGEKRVLDGFSLEIRRGERVLITGENGSGKSTLARLLAGLLEPEKGAVCYNGEDIQAIDPAALREKVLLVPSEPFIISGTARDNLWSGADEETLRRAGIDKPIEKGGGNLSNGQKKRLQLCRALASRAEVVIFDEPFNFIDRGAKEDFWREILSTFADRTLVVISHDAFPAKDCGRIVELRAEG